MRRLPIYFLIDVSESMVGTPLREVEQGMRTIIQDLRVDPYALETVFVSIIAFAGKARTLSPLTELYKFYPPEFPIGGGTSLGTGLELLMDDITKNVKKTTPEEKGDWKPIVFLFTDGNPTDDYQAAFRRWNEKFRRSCNLVAVSIGDNVDVLTLAQLTDNILLLKETDAESFRKFFKWVTASIKTTSMSVTDTSEDELKLAPTNGINLEKANPTETVPGTPDDNYVVLHARCSNTKRDYLVKFIHTFGSSEMGGEDLYRLQGAYPVDKEEYASMSSGKKPKINTKRLRGIPTCPCCGNQIGIVVCDCGGLFCAGEEETICCPWCGESGSLGEGSSGGMDITRGLG